MLLNYYTHLEPGVAYNVSIAAVNRAGLGAINAMILFTRELGKTITNLNCNKPLFFPQLLILLP